MTALDDSSTTRRLPMPVFSKAAFSITRFLRRWHLTQLYDLFKKPWIKIPTFKARLRETLRGAYACLRTRSETRIFVSIIYPCLRMLTQSLRMLTHVQRHTPSSANFAYAQPYAKPYATLRTCGENNTNFFTFCCFAYAGLREILRNLTHVRRKQYYFLHFLLFCLRGLTRNLTQPYARAAILLKMSDESRCFFNSLHGGLF